MTLTLGSIEYLARNGRSEEAGPLLERLVLARTRDAARRVDVRIVTATNRDLKKLVAEGRIREDFYYRVRVFEIALPPLRERRGDIPLLVSRFLAEMAEVQARPRRVASDEALRALVDYAWPGNIRELRNALDHALVVVEGDAIQLADLPTEVRSPASGRAPVPAYSGARSEDDRRIIEALRKSGSNRLAAAKELGVSRVTLWKKLKRLGVDRGPVTSIRR